MSAAGQLRREGLTHRLQEEAARLAHAAANDADGRVEDRSEGGDALAQPATQGGELLDRERVTGTGGLGDQWTGDPVDVEPPRASDRASRTIADPEAYCSQQPWLPQPHSTPPGTTRMWPISAPTPNAPR